MKLSKEQIKARNDKIFEMNKEGINQIQIAKKFGISGQRVGQILLKLNLNKNIKDLKKSNANFVSEIIDSDMSDKIKIKLIGGLFNDPNKPNANFVSEIIDSDMSDKIKIKLLEIYTNSI